MRIVVAEDSVLFREGLVRLLTEAGHEIVAAVGDTDSLKREVAELMPDLAVIDIRMPPQFDSAGAEAAVELRASHTGVALLLLSQHVELRHCRELIGTAAFGYLLKDRVLDLDDFTEAIERVGGGGTALDPEVVRALVRSSRTTALDDLTAREREVLSHVAEGHSNTAVARLLTLSERTVEAHMRSVFLKLGLPEDGETHRRVRAVVAYLSR